MGNYKFRLSDMIPNAWFYKLRDMSKSKNQTKKLSPNPRKSFYSSPRNSKAFDTLFPHTDHPPPRKSSSRKRSKRKTIYMPSPSKISPSFSSSSIFQVPGNIPGYQEFYDSPIDFPTSSPDKIFLESLSSSDFEYNFCDHTHQCKLSSSANDIIFDMNLQETLKADTLAAESNIVSEPEPELRPVLTKPTKQNATKRKKNARKSIYRSSGVKIRGNISPKLVSKKIESTKRVPKKGLFHTESFALVKSSFDPERDFKESMMEMIVENNIKASKDLEELLACYLSLNSNQYHDLIIKAFENIWFNMPHL